MPTRVLIVAAWLIAALVIVASLSIFSNPVLPSPAALLARLWELLCGPLWNDLLLTSVRSMLAFVLALVSGIAWAAFFPPRSKRGTLAAPTLLLLQAAPVILWIVPLVLVLGAGRAAPVLAAIFVVMPLVAFEFRTAFEMTSRDRREFWRHYVPDYRRRIALRLNHEWRPHLASATGMGVLMSFKASVIAEWFAAKDGIGRKLQQAFVIVDTASFLAYAVAFLIAALAATALAQSLMRRPWFSTRSSTAHVESDLPKYNKESSALQLIDVSYCYGSKEILHGVNLTLRAGEVAVLTGQSGCGKSTLAKIAAGILRPQRGKLMQPLNGVCLAFQSDFLFPAEPVSENVAFFPSEKNSAAVQTSIEQAGLTGELVAGGLSGGMRRRLALARALAAPQSYLILDEPFTGLDAAATAELVAVIGREAHAGRGLLIITHTVSPALRKQARYVYTLQDGRLVLNNKRALSP